MSGSGSDSDDAPHPAARREESRCGGCGQGATRVRRGLCAACYARWVRARPVGLGASCACCNDRRLVHLRHFELRGLWVVLCHNCCARAERMTPAARSVDQLLAGIRRQRRGGGERRVTGNFDLGAGDRRRDNPGRRAEDGVLDATELVIIEIEADYAQPEELRDPDGEPITAVHSLVSRAEL